MLFCLFVVTERVIRPRQRQSNRRLHQWLILKAVPNPRGGAIQDGAHLQITIVFPIRAGRAKQIVLDEIIDRFADGRFIPGAFLRAKSVGRFVPCAFLQARRIGCFSV